MADEYFYPGTKYRLDPTYGDLFSGYRIPAGRLGATTSIQTANQLNEVNNLLNQGIKNIEVSTISPDIFEQIPKQHLKEINRLTKLTGTETSLHAPMLDPSGFSRGGWDESSRQSAERQFTNIAERAHELNPEGNIPITIHSSGGLDIGVPGTEYIPVKDEKTGKMIEVPQRFVFVNQETGEFGGLQREKRFELAEGKEMYSNFKDELKRINENNWNGTLTNLFYYKQQADHIIKQAFVPLAPLLIKTKAGEKIDLSKLDQGQKEAYDQLSQADVFLKNVELRFNEMYNRAYKFSDENTKDRLRKISKDWKSEVDSMGKEGNILNQPFKKAQLLDRALGEMRQIGAEAPPQVYRPIDDFAKEKASETLGNVAWNSYKKFKESSPIISIENPPAGGAISRAEDLKDLVLKTRDKFVQQAVKNGMSESKARDASEKLIGVTWDTSHISMVRKQGFGPEKLVEEAKIIAPYLKHIHLNDNFGGTHTDLPPGMGDVPMKDVLEQFSGFKGKMIHEGGSFFAQFQTPPNEYVLEAMGSPVYAMDMAPYWNQSAGLRTGYFGGQGAEQFLPSINYETFGAGFSNLPMELGGNRRGGAGGRMSGTPME